MAERNGCFFEQFIHGFYRAILVGFDSILIGAQALPAEYCRVKARGNVRQGRICKAE